MLVTNILHLAGIFVFFLIHIFDHLSIICLGNVCIFLSYASNFLKLYIHMYLQTCAPKHNVNAYEVLSDSHSYFTFDSNICFLFHVYDHLGIVCLGDLSVLLRYVHNLLKLYIHVYLQTCILTQNSNAYKVSSDSQNIWQTYRLFHIYGQVSILSLPDIFASFHLCLQLLKLYIYASKHNTYTFKC